MSLISQFLLYHRTIGLNALQFLSDSQYSFCLLSFHVYYSKLKILKVWLRLKVTIKIKESSLPAHVLLTSNTFTDACDSAMCMHVCAHTHPHTCVCIYSYFNYLNKSIDKICSHICCTVRTSLVDWFLTRLGEEIK